MTENRRIVLNIAATYGRSLFAMVCGIFAGRWALMALGEVDYGLQGLVGGLTAFIGFFNDILAAAVGRFYALSVGKARTDAAAGIEESRRWFSIALVIHTVIPTILLVVGWPIGEWAIRHFLTIPPDRVDACLWVFRFSCVGCFLGMVSVPFNAFYGAKQLIAELTIYGFATTTLNVVLLYWMVTHPADWLVKYALWLTLLGVVPSLIITVRAIRLFPECRFQFAYCHDWPRFKKLFAYSFWQLFGSFAVLLRMDGIVVIVNKYFGASVNAALAISRNVSSKADRLAASMLEAFTPAITSAYGAGDMNRAFALANRVCKFSVLTSLVFVIPLALELPYVMKLWLVTPPKFVTMLCYAVMAQKVINKITKGHTVLLHASGRLGGYEMLTAVFSISMVGLAWGLIVFGVGPLSVGIAFIGMAVLCAGVRPLFTRHQLGMSISTWFHSVLTPLVSVTVLALACGSTVVCLLPTGFLRVCITLLVCESALLPSAWFLLFDDEERECVKAQIRKVVFRRVA